LELNTFIKQFNNLIESSLNNNFEFYLFGSFVNNLNYNDIDIIIIYSDYTELQKIKDVISQEFKAHLIHYTCFTKTEENELFFIEKVNAIKII
jgi:predicted nucleotidyltransferase